MWRSASDVERQLLEHGVDPTPALATEARAPAGHRQTHRRDLADGDREVPVDRRQLRHVPDAQPRPAGDGAVDRRRWRR